MQFGMVSRLELLVLSCWVEVMGTFVCLLGRRWRLPVDCCGMVELRLEGCWLRGAKGMRQLVIG